MSRRPDWRREDGQASIELVGLLFWLLLTAFAVWQIMLVAWTFNQATNAARLASRIEARGGDPERAARHSVNGVLRDGMKVEISPDGETATVRVRIPIIIPGLDSDRLRATRAATLPG